MNASFHNQLAQVRLALFGSAKPKRERKPRKVAEVPVSRNTTTHVKCNSVTIHLPL